MYALLTVGYNFDGIQSPVVIRQGDPVPAPPAAPILSLPNFYGAHGYDPTLPNLSSIFYAAGPNIGQGVLPLAHNVDVVPTVAAMLGVQTYEAVDGIELPIGPLRLTNVVSRKTHGSAGTFDLPLPVSGLPGVEGRKATDSGGHTLVLTFNKPLATANAIVVAGRGVLSGAASVVGQQVIVNLSGVHDAQLVTLSLTGVTDVYGGTAESTFSFGVLWGDVDGNGIVSNADLDAITTAAEGGGGLNEATFRLDVNVSGKINNADIVQTRNHRTQDEL